MKKTILILAILLSGCASVQQRQEQAAQLAEPTEHQRAALAVPMNLGFCMGALFAIMSMP